MKRILKRIFPILLVIVVIFSILWYLFIYDQDFTQDLLIWNARYFEKNGKHTVAAWFYQQAYLQAEDSPVMKKSSMMRWCPLFSKLRMVGVRPL